MEKISRPERQQHTATAIRNYLGIIIVFFLLVSLLPASHIVMQMYGMSARQYHILLFFVELPLAAVWLAAFIGYARLREYADALGAAKDAEGYRQLARGCQWLAVGLPITSLTSLLLNSFAGSHPGFHTTAIIISNYVGLLFPLIAFTKMSSGSRTLVSNAHIHVSMRAARALQLSFAVIGVLFCFLTFRHLDLSHLDSTNNPYFLPIWLLVVSIIIPYLYAWFTGLLAAYDIALLAKRSKGLLYRSALQLLAIGLVVVIACFIGAQYVRSVSPRSGHLSLNTTLVTIYLIYVAIIAGFMCMVLGALRLKRIEEV